MGKLWQSITKGHQSAQGTIAHNVNISVLKLPEELIRFVNGVWCEIFCHKYFEMGANSHRLVRHPLQRYGNDRTIWTLSAQENTPPLCWPPSSFSLLVCLSLLVRLRSNRNTKKKRKKVLHSSVSESNLALLSLGYISTVCCRIMWGWDER